MIIHFVPDDKFIDGFIEKYLLYHDDKKVMFVCIVMANYNKKYIKNERVRLITFKSSEYKNIIENIHTFDVVYFHSFLMFKSLYILKQIPVKVKIAWIFWGAEFFKNGIFQKFYDDCTKKVYLDRIENVKLKKFGVFKTIAKYFWLKIVWFKLLILYKALQRIDYFLHWNYYDYVFVKSLIPNSKSVFVEFAYGENTTLKSNVNSFKKVIKNRTIIVGNSATFSNNHFSILEILSKRNEEFEIICPLSYGDKEYAKIVIDYGKKLFGSRFKPLTEFMPKDEYFKLIQGADCLIFNNIRTQAASNIFYALSIGKKVFLNSENTHLKFLQERNIMTFSTSLLQNINYELFSEIDDTDRNIMINNTLCLYNSFIDNYKAIF